jgi:hypothetical protein
VPSPHFATQGFDRLSTNGVGFVLGVPVLPIILSLSKGRLSPNGTGFVLGVPVFPIILSLSKDRLSPNGVGGDAKKENFMACRAVRIADLATRR